MKGFQDEVELLDGSMVLGDLINKHIYDRTCAEKSPFFVADLGEIVKQHIRWRAKMKQIRPFYSVKSNSSPVVLDVLAALGTGFVCSNKKEVDLVKGFGVQSHDIILAGACKQLSHIKHAAKHHITLLVCDNEVEMRKIARFHPKANLLLWLRPGHCCEETLLPFGSSLKNCRHLMKSAAELGLRVTGVKFSVPSCCQHRQSFSHAVAEARCVFDMGEEHGFKMNILDIGDSFDGSEAQMDEVNAELKPMLDMYFPLSAGLSIIAEPGAYYVSSAFTLAINIIDKKNLALDLSGQSQRSCHIDNSEGQGTAVICQDDLTLHPLFIPPTPSFKHLVIRLPGSLSEVSPEEPLFSSCLWGPSEDNLDQIVDRCLLPELSVGDWLIFRNAGASIQGSLFINGEQRKPAVFYCITPCDWKEILNCGITLDVGMKNVSLL
ncbi:hypothetical protein DNTS_029997 [Danionella cerebrum]|uniref:Orn/DAP/Arg decarboxylase 2 N-terminal domain-containing protein n=1 Tax=Danionella cerebrum TaxID=2873325 RepID=A0A553QFB2_9TELE|nr:hypothetical protein DNTS_029997 [Danionella translucida]